MLGDVTETSFVGSNTLTWILFPLNIDRVVFGSEEITEYQTYQMNTKDPEKLQKILGNQGISILRKVFGIILLAIGIKLFTTNIKLIFA